MRAVLVFVCFALGGCGACQRVASHQAAFRAEAPKASPRPHLSVDLSEATLTRWLDEAVAGLPKASFRLPGLGDLGRHLGAYSIAVRRLAVTADLHGTFMVDLDFEIRDGGRTLLALELRAQAPIEYDRERGRVVLALRADLFDKVKPKLPGDALDGLSAALHAQVPAVARALITRSTVKRLLRGAFDEIVERAYALLRDEVLTPVGEIARLELDLPGQLPLAGLALRKGRGGDLRLDVRTTLAAEGLPAHAPKSRPAEGQLRVRVSTDLVVALGNWAMARGHLPRRYDGGGAARDDWAFEAGLDWHRGAERPLKVNLWAVSDPAGGVCLRARAGATPSVAYRDGTLSVGFEDGRIEELDGPPLVEVALGVLGGGARALEHTEKFAAGLQLRLGSDRFAAVVQAASLNARALTFELALGRPDRSSRGFEPGPRLADSTWRQLVHAPR